MKSPYCFKYDHTNEGTRIIFDNFYDILANKHHVKSNMRACCGRDVARYIGYGKKICTSGNTRLFLMENNECRFRALKRRIAREKLDYFSGRVRPIYGDIFNDSKISRIEDIGLGIGVRKMLIRATARLYDQKRNTKNYSLVKAQILDSAVRQVKVKEIIVLYNFYLSTTIGVRLKKINNISIESSEIAHCFQKDNAKVIETYTDPLTNKIGRVLEHKVKLDTKDVKLYMYSCQNGSNMLSSMLVY